jgi:predicted DNA-binding transcriptional regulator AlpA
MKYEFELVLDREPADEELDLLFEAGCDDMTFGTDGTTATALVRRRAASFVEAATSAIVQVESAPDLRVLSILADPQLTLGEIAERASVSRETVRRHVNDPAFPRPVNATPRHRLWRWSDVAPAFGVRDPLLEEAAPAARALDAWLVLRAAAPDVTPRLEDVAAALRTAADGPASAANGAQNSPRWTRSRSAAARRRPAASSG